MGLFRNLQKSFAYFLTPSQFVGWIDAVSDALDASPANLPNNGSFNTATVGAVGSGRVADIPLAQLTPLVSGTSIWVQSFRTYFHWEPASTVTADGITYLNPIANAANPGRFVRDPTAMTEWYQNVAFSLYIDFTLGNDENDGSAQVQGAGLVGPVKTHAELNRRLGPIVEPSVSLTIIQIGDNVSESAYYTINCKNGGNFYLRGLLPTASFTGTISAHTDLAVTANPATSDFADITSTWTPATELNRLIQNTTLGTFSWVDLDLTGGKARVSPGCTPNLAAPGAVTPTVNSANGNAISTYVLPKMSPRVINLNPTGFLGNDNFVCIQFFDLVKVGTDTFKIGDQVIVQNCAISSSLTDALSAGCTFQNCQYVIGGSSIPAGDLAPSEIIWMSGHIHSGAWTISRKSFLQFQNDTLINATPFTISNNAFLSLIGAGWCNTSTPVTLSNLGQMRCLAPSANGGGAWSSSKAANANTGVGVASRRGTQLTLDAGTVPTLTGASGDFTVSAAATALAFDPALALYNATPRACTWALLTTSFAGGGFGSALFDPVSCAYLGVNS